MSIRPKSTKNDLQASVSHFNAVRARFELAEPLNRFGSLANCWIQPLSHLTVVCVGQMDCKYNIFLINGFNKDLFV